MKDLLDIKFNVRITARKHGVLIPEFTRVSHNVFVNGGRSWLKYRLGGSAYGVSPPTPHVTSVLAYIGFGCGGALQPDNQFANSQPEIVTVDALEDPVPYSRGGGTGDVRQYLKLCENQNLTTEYFPNDFRTLFIASVAETEISFAGNATRTSNVTVNTSVPVSEAGLYLSTALPNFSHPAVAGEADPAGANELAAYNIFEPIPVTPGIVLRAEWELRT